MLSVACPKLLLRSRVRLTNLPWLVVVVCVVYSVTFMLCNSILVLKMDLCILIFASPRSVDNEGLTVMSLTVLFLC